MQIEILETEIGAKIFLYFREINVGRKMDENYNQLRLKQIDKLVTIFAKTGKFKDLFYLWNRFEPGIIRIISRTYKELDANEIKIIDNKFDIFEKSLSKLLQ